MTTTTEKTGAALSSIGRFVKGRFEMVLLALMLLLVFFRKDAIKAHEPWAVYAVYGLIILGGATIVLKESIRFLRNDTRADFFQTFACVWGMSLFSLNPDNPELLNVALIFMTGLILPVALVVGRLYAIGPVRGNQTMSDSLGPIVILSFLTCPNLANDTMFIAMASLSVVSLIGVAFYHLHLVRQDSGRPLTN